MLPTGKSPPDIKASKWKISTAELWNWRCPKNQMKPKYLYLPKTWRKGVESQLVRNVNTKPTAKQAKPGHICPKCNDWRVRMSFEDNFPMESAQHSVHSTSSFLSFTENKHNNNVSRYFENWLFDSGATVHMTTDPKYMEEMEPTDKEVTVGNGNTIKATSKGNLTLKHPQGHMLKLSNVLYVPKFNRNILSMGRILKNNTSVKASHNSLTIQRNGQNMHLELDKKTNMFYLRAKRVKTHQIFNNEITTEKASLISDIQEAHDKFGHPGAATLYKTGKYYGMKLTGTIPPCDGCMRAKAKVKAIATTQTYLPATKVGERLYIDTSGPFPPSMGGNQYWAKICDEFSGKNWNSFTKSKKTIQESLEDLIIMLKAKGHEVKYLRCDNAGEHTNFDQLCNQMGITLEYTAPNTPQHNGVVELPFVTDRDRAMAMMFAAGLTPQMQQNLKCEAINTASILGDLLVTTTRNKSAYELFYGKKSNLIPHLVEFGRIGYVTQHKQHQKKFTDKTNKCIMVGYASNHAAGTYRLYDTTTKQIILS